MRMDSGPLVVQTQFDFREDAAIFGLSLTSGRCFLIRATQGNKKWKWKGNKVREVLFENNGKLLPTIEFPSVSSESKFVI
jgi:hypothetical protein